MLRSFPNNQNQKKISFFQMICILALIISILLNITLLIILLTKNVNPCDTNTTTNTKTSTSVEDKLKSILLLPSDKFEIGKINNVDKLKEQMPNVYKNAKNGDFLFIFEDRMIIFRESENKVINYVYLTK
ncbi:MAG: hypothetical protein NZZ41_07380 [Candidatus Dojkabacteria bacterium]|nr:hypothetical protein [Candidatus Dojkabacteria bacterium]